MKCNLCPDETPLTGMVALIIPDPDLSENTDAQVAHHTCLTGFIDTFFKSEILTKFTLVIAPIQDIAPNVLGGRDRAGD